MKEQLREQYNAILEDEILETFNRLLKRKPFDQITVGQICEAAEISRSTFYRHFSDKYDVMNYNYKKMFRYAMASSSSTTELATTLYENYRDQLRSMKNIFSPEGFNAFIPYVHRFLYDKFLEMIGTDLELSEKTLMKIDLYTCGLAGISRKWVEGNYSMTAEEFAVASLEMMPEEIRQILEEKTASRTS